MGRAALIRVGVSAYRSGFRRPGKWNRGEITLPRLRRGWARQCEQHGRVSHRRRRREPRMVCRNCLTALPKMRALGIAVEIENEQLLATGLKDDVNRDRGCICSALIGSTWGRRD